MPEFLSSSCRVLHIWRQSIGSLLRRIQAGSCLLGLGAVLSLDGISQSGNLLQNPDFQSDWLCLMQESHSLHWCYLANYHNRRDYNPDAWWCKGNWQWNNDDALPGERHLMLQGLGTVVSQAVNWAVVYDDTYLPPNGQIADDGGFPLCQTVISDQPLRMVRDLTLRVQVRGTNIPSGAGNMELRLYSTSSTVVATSPWPTGSYDWRWLSVSIPAATWLAGTPAIGGGSSRVLPMFASARFTYNNAAGAIELGRAELTEPGPSSPNLLSNGGFEAVDATNYPTGWSAPRKYLRFSLKLFYLFQTWHNALSDNRGPVMIDTTVAHSGSRSLKMIMAAGDEKMVVSDPLILNQPTNRPIEVVAWIKTDRIAMLHIGAMDQNGALLPGYNIIQKAKVTPPGAQPPPVVALYAHTSPYQYSIVANSDWVMVRQVLRPKTPVTSLRLQLCVRGVNGCTLNDTGEQPQNSAVGTIWWDDVRVYEPESTAAELASRGVMWGSNAYVSPGLQLVNLDLGERLWGVNFLKTELFNPGPAQPFTLRWKFTSPSGQVSTYASDTQAVPSGGRRPFQIPYVLSESTKAYAEYHGQLDVINYAGIVVASNTQWFSTWTTPIHLQLGALYPPPDMTNLLIRLNIGLTRTTMASTSKVRLDILRRTTGTVTATMEIPATSNTIVAQRSKIPAEIYDDCFNLLLADLSIDMLPIQPFNNPERQWLVRASVLDTNGVVLASVDSDPFCRLAHDTQIQYPITNVVITTNNLLLVDDKPWMPWGRIYNNVPTYNGPADPGAGKYRDLKNLPTWNLYGWRFGKETNTRPTDDFNVIRYYCSQNNITTISNNWANASINLAAGTGFPYYGGVSTLAALFAKFGSQANCDARLSWFSNAAMVVSIGAGIEESFGQFVPMSDTDLNGWKTVTDYLRSHTGKPIMVSHGGYWNRFEFEKIPFFDLFDPETEPWFPANIQTDLMPFIRGKNKACWIRPQMYETVPYERWRFHTYVELMRGCRGWQMAHGTGDLSLYRGLHGELEFIKPIAYSTDPGPAVTIEPDMEHWVRRYNGKTYIIAATTRGLALGRYRWADDHRSPVGRSRLTTGRSEVRSDDNSYAMGLEPLVTGPTVHGINHMPDSRPWPDGSKLVQWVYLDPKATPTNLMFLVKADGRWLYGTYWGSMNPNFNQSYATEEWFIRSLYRMATGFLNWGPTYPWDSCKIYTMSNAVLQGPMFGAGLWQKIEVPLNTIGITSTQQVEGAAFIHDENGRVWWSHTTIESPTGETQVFFGDSVELPASALAHTRINVEGMTPSATIRALFEDRTISAQDGCFYDDFRGKDIYQRFGGDFGLGYGAAPVDLHIYEIDGL